jgi:carboxyl-terminal processing protease
VCSSDLRKEKEARELREKTREKEGETAADIEHGGNDGLQANERSLDEELLAEKARKKMKDVLLNEAVNILVDQVSLAAQKTAIVSARTTSE